MNKLSINDIAQLRNRKLILEIETAICEGDLIIAVNPINGVRRIIGKLTELQVESSKKLLLD